MTPTDTVVSEERLRECPFCGGQGEYMPAGAQTADCTDVFVRCTDCGIEGPHVLYEWETEQDDPRDEAIAAWNRRTATPQGGGVVVKGLEWMPASRGPVEAWSETMLLQRRGHHNLGRYAGSYAVSELRDGGPWGWWNSWTSDRYPEGVEPDENAAIAACEADFEARIRSTLADPIPEAPADEEVERVDELDPKALAAAEQVYTETSVYPIVPANHDAALAQAIRAYLRAALRRSTETDKPGVREAALEEAAKVVEGFALSGNAGAAKSIVAKKMAKAIRALSASPLTEEQPTHRHKKSGNEYVLIGIGKMQAELWVDASKLTELPGPAGRVDMREVAVYRSATDPTEMWVRPREEFEDGRFETLPRSTTGGAKVMDTKYVIFTDGKQEFAVIFPRELGHKDVADGVRMLVHPSNWSQTAGPAQPIAAGFVGDGKRGSLSLKMGPRPEDAALIRALFPREWLA